MVRVVQTDPQGWLYQLGLGRVIRVGLKVITHPVFIFVGFQCVWVILTLFWIFWFARDLEGVDILFDAAGNAIGIQRTGTTAMAPPAADHLTDSPATLSALSFYSQMMGQGQVLGQLIAGLVMLGTLLSGAIWLFWFGQRKASYYRQQQAFISSVTHELRTPITTLNLVFSNLKNHQLQPERVVHLLEIGDQQLTRLMNLINNILLTARLDRGIEMLDEKKQKLTVKALLEMAVERNKSLDQAIFSRVTIQCLPALAIVGPRSALVTLFANLIQNAIKYSPALSPVEITVSLYGGDYVDIRFKDYGCGIEDESELKKIFKMFYRGMQSTQHGVGGTGVGLFIVKTIVKLLRGSVWAQSEGKDKGLTITVRLPID